MCQLRERVGEEIQRREFSFTNYSSSSQFPKGTVRAVKAVEFIKTWSTTKTFKLRPKPMGPSAVTHLEPNEETVTKLLVIARRTPGSYFGEVRAVI